jgi:hypothetical protein
MLYSPWSVAAISDHPSLIRVTTPSRGPSPRNKNRNLAPSPATARHSPASLCFDERGVVVRTARITIPLTTLILSFISISVARSHLG